MFGMRILGQWKLTTSESLANDGNSDEPVDALRNGKMNPQ